MTPTGERPIYACRTFTGRHFSWRSPPPQMTRRPEESPKRRVVEMFPFTVVSAANGANQLAARARQGEYMYGRKAR